MSKKQFFYQVKMFDVQKICVGIKKNKSHKLEKFIRPLKIIQLENFIKKKSGGKCFCKTKKN